MQMKGTEVEIRGDYKRQHRIKDWKREREINGHREHIKEVQTRVYQVAQKEQTEWGEAIFEELLAKNFQELIKNIEWSFIFRKQSSQPKLNLSRDENKRQIKT